MVDNIEVLVMLGDAITMILLPRGAKFLISLAPKPKMTNMTNSEDIPKQRHTLTRSWPQQHQTTLSP